MIQTIVSLYRAAIVAIFIAGAAFSAMIMLSGSWGFLIGIALIGALVMCVGISALLISINDHLAALRTDEAPASMRLQEPPRNKSWKATATISTFLVASALAVYASGVIPKTEEPPVVETRQPPTLKMGGSVKEGCVPDLAAQVGLKCRDE